MSRRWCRNRQFRLLATLWFANGVIVVGELLLSVALAVLLLSGSAPLGQWTFLLAAAIIAGIFAGQLLMLCLVGALVKKSRWSMWLAVMPFALLLSVAFLSFQFGPGIYMVASFRDPGGALEMILLLAAVVPAALCYGGVLLASVLLWPLKVFCGWAVAWLDESDVSIPKVPISHLMIWVGLWGALFLLLTTLSEGFGTVAVIAGAIGIVIVLIAGFPVMHILSGGRWTSLQGISLLVFVLLLSLVESELIYWIAQPSGFTSIYRVVPIVIAFNASLAITIALNCHLMNRRGLRLHMPLPWRRGTRPSHGTVAMTSNS